MNVFLQSVTEFAEKAMRQGVLGLPGRRREKALLRDLQSYFAELKRQVIGLGLENKHLDRLTARHVVEAALKNVMRHRQEGLRQALEAGLRDAYLTASKLNPLHEADKDDFTLTAADYNRLGDTAKAAAIWAEGQAARLVIDLDQTSIDRIASAVEQGIEQQLGAEGTGRLIRETLDEMSRSRALTIASTEINRAMSAATLDKLAALEIMYKQWILDADPCEICIGNADQGAIPVDEDFESGDDAPPAHPNCRCACAGARAPEGEDQ